MYRICNGVIAGDVDDDLAAIKPVPHVSQGGIHYGVEYSGYM